MKDQPKTQYSKDREIIVCIEDNSLVLKTIYRWEYGDPIEADVDHILSSRKAVSLMANIAGCVKKMYSEDEYVSRMMNMILSLIANVVSQVDSRLGPEGETKVC